jgi:hypothetical protein
MSLILSGSDGLSDIDGSAATPAIRGTDANTGIFFPAADTIAFSTGGTEDARFNSAGNLQTLGTISVGNATPSTSGAGITFPATQSASSDVNTLDDYEEGSFTPTYTGATNPTVTYGAQVGKYTKIGNVVYYFIRLDTTAVSGGSGALSISGLPFTVLSDSTVPAAYVGYKAGWTTYAPDFGRSNATSVELYRTNGGSESAINIGNLASNVGFVICGMYRVA